MSNHTSQSLRAIVNDCIARTVAIVGLAGFALVHLLDLRDTITGTPYIGWMYIGLIASAIALGGTLLRSSDTRAWAATGALVASVMVCYVLSRTTGLPQSTDDIGNWGEPLGIAMLFIGSSLLALTGGVLLRRRALRETLGAPGTLERPPVRTPRRRRVSAVA